MNKIVPYMGKCIIVTVLFVSLSLVTSCYYHNALMAILHDLPDEREFYVYEVNNSGEIASENILPSGNRYNVLLYPGPFNGEMLIAGNSSFSDTSSDAYIARLSSDYKLVFERKIHFDKGDVVGTADVFSDGSMLLGGSSRVEDGKIYYRMLMFKTDSTGNKLWNKAEKMNESTWYSADVCAMDDGGALVIAEEVDFFFQDQSENIIRYDKDGNKMWKKSFYPWLFFDPITNGKIIQTGQDSFINFFGQHSSFSVVLHVNGTDGTFVNPAIGDDGLFTSTVTIEGVDVDLGISPIFVNDRIYSHDMDLLIDDNLVFVGTSMSKKNIKTIVTSQAGLIIGEAEYAYDANKYIADNVQVCPLGKGFAVIATFHSNDEDKKYKYQTVAGFTLQGYKIWSMDFSSNERVYDMAATLDGELRLLVEKK